MNTSRLNRKITQMTNSTAKHRFHVPLAFAATIGLLVLTACTAPSGAQTAGDEQQGAVAAAGLTVNTSAEQDRITTTVSPEAVALLPEGIAADGKLKVSVSAYVPPLAFFADDEKTPIGHETDIASLVADALGLELELEVKAWADWPLALQSGDVEAVISNVTVTEERKELFDFATYRTDEVAWLVKADSAITEILEPADLAGLTIAVASGTNQEKVLIAWDELNQANGLEPVKIEYFENDGDTTLALQSGRIDVGFGPNAASAFKAAVAPQDFKVVGTVNGGWPKTAQTAVATAKGNGLVDATAAALNHAIADGSYQKVLARWGMEAEALPASEINPAGLPKP